MQEKINACALFTWSGGTNNSPPRNLALANKVTVPVIQNYRTDEFIRGAYHIPTYETALVTTAPITDARHATLGYE